MKYDELVSVFGSKMKADEILYLLYGEKLVVRQGFYESEKQKVQDYCDFNELFIAWSDFKVVNKDKDGFFSNKGERVPIESKDFDLIKGMQFCYISKDERLSLFGQLFEKQGNHARLGELLGYPFCCQMFFCANFSKENFNPVVEDLKGLMSLDFRREDICLLSHFPCSNLCEESNLIVRRRFKFLEVKESKRAKEIQEFMQV